MTNLISSVSSGYSRSENYNRVYNNNSQNSHRTQINRNMNPQNHIQNNMSAQTMARCPHGFPGGACPLCMGQGGGGGGSDKKKVQTGMSWSEAFYVWSKLQNIERITVDDQKMLEAARQRLKILENIESSRLYQQFMDIKNIIQDRLEEIKNTLIQLQQNVSRIVVNTITNIVNVINICISKMIDVVNKLAAIIGEKFKNIRDAFEKNLKAILDKLIKIKMIAGLLRVINDKSLQFQEFMMRKIESVKEKIQKFIDSIRLIVSKDQEQRQNKKQSNKKKKKGK